MCIRDSSQSLQSVPPSLSLSACAGAVGGRDGGPAGAVTREAARHNGPSLVSLNACQRMRANANVCARDNECASECERVPTNANECQRMPSNAATSYAAHEGTRR
eukprot:2886483-Rhodomonas_salina.1